MQFHQLCFIQNGLFFRPFQCDVPEGGLVPKSFYMRDDELEKDRSPDEVPFGADTLYHTAHVVKDWPHEVRS